MHQNSRVGRAAPAVRVSVPEQTGGDHDVLLAGSEAPATTPAGRRRLLSVLAALALVAGAAWQADGRTGGAEPDVDEQVSLSLVTTVTSAAPVRQQDGASFTSLRLRVALRNDGASWVTLDDVALGPYRAHGDGLGALAPGALASVPLERHVVCGRVTSPPAPRLVEVDVLSGAGRSTVHLGLPTPAEVDPAAVLPECTA